MFFIYYTFLLIIIYFHSFFNKTYKKKTKIFLKMYRKSLTFGDWASFPINLYIYK